MARAVEEKMAASGPAEVVVAEQRLQAQARQVAAGLNAESHRVEHQRAVDQVGHGAYDATPDPAAAEPAPDPRFAPAPDPPYDDPATDPRYDDRR